MTKAQLEAENAALRARVAKLEAREVARRERLRASRASGLNYSILSFGRGYYEPGIDTPPLPGLGAESVPQPVGQ